MRQWDSIEQEKNVRQNKKKIQYIFGFLWKCIRLFGHLKWNDGRAWSAFKVKFKIDAFGLEHDFLNRDFHAHIFVADFNLTFYYLHFNEGNQSEIQQNATN